MAQQSESPVVAVIDLKPSWHELARVLIVLLENGSHEGKVTARKEIERMGQIIDHMSATWTPPAKAKG